MSKERVLLVSPVGIAKFPYLSKPDTQFKKEGKFRVGLALNPADEKVAEFLKMLEGMVRKELPKGRLPFVDDMDLDKDKKPTIKTGKVLVKFASGFKPKMFDSLGHVLPDEVNVGSKSLIRVSFTTNIYPAFGGGMNLYLQAVQVLELKEWKEATLDSFGFNVEDGFDAQPDPLLTPEENHDEPF